MSELILYGRGLIAEEYCRYLSAQGREVTAFAVTTLAGQGATYCGRPCMEIGETLAKFPEAEIHLALQEKYHAEVIDMLKEKGRTPKEVVGLRRMTELLGEQATQQISAACPGLTVRRCPYDYSMLEVNAKEHPEKRFTFYPMCQVPLSVEDLKHIKEYLQMDNLYIAMATSGKDAKVGHENLPEFVHPVLGGAASYVGERSGELEYDDEGDNISAYNHLYSELTVAYWLWKKAPKVKYLGLCHYRRHFVLTEEIKSALADGSVDVLLTRPRLTFPNVRSFFTEFPVGHMDKLDYETMLEYISRIDKKMADFAENFFSGQVQFPNNMVIAKREIYLDYCRFMFTVLLGMQEAYRERKIDRPNRNLGNVGEMLTTLYFVYHRDKWRTDFIDYRLLA